MTMNRFHSAKIVLAALLLVAITGVLTGCTRRTETARPAAPSQGLLEILPAVRKDVRLMLKADRQGKQVKVTVLAENPSGKALTSVESWIAYNPAHLKGVSIDTSSSAFPLSAPYAAAFDAGQGIVQVGRSSPTPVTGKLSTVAVLTFEILKAGTTTLDLFDYRTDLSGHASVNVVLKGRPYNVLIKPESPALIIQN